MVQEAVKNIEIVKRFKERIRKRMVIESIILFGSRAKGTFDRHSDFDLLVVSKDFRGIPWYKRPVSLYMMWNENFPLELLCYTPEEIEKRRNRPGIVSEALRKGIVV